MAKSKASTKRASRAPRLNRGRAIDRVGELFARANKNRGFVSCVDNLMGKIDWSSASSRDQDALGHALSTLIHDGSPRLAAAVAAAVEDEHGFFEEFERGIERRRQLAKLLGIDEDAAEELIEKYDRTAATAKSAESRTA